MILNERQLRISRGWLRRFQRELERARQSPSKLGTRLHKAVLDGLASQIADLEAEIAEFERLRSAVPESLELRSLSDLPLLLIRMRIVRHLSQEALASRLGVRPQQVQRWEAGAYERATYHRLVQVAGALQFDVGNGRVVSKGPKRGRRK